MTEQSSLQKQIAALADARLDSSRSDFSWLNDRLRDGERYWGKRPELTRLIDIVFTQLGIQAPAAELESYINSFVGPFNERVHDVTLRERSRMFGGDITPDTSVRRTFTGLREAFEDFHGAVYDYELITAECLGYYVIEQSQAAEQEANQSDGQNFPKSA